MAMYKTISIQNKTYQELSAIANKLKKPKAQVVDDLVKNYWESVKDKEQEELRAFNKKMDELRSRIKLPKGTVVNTDDTDGWFSDLKDEDF